MIISPTTGPNGTVVTLTDVGFTNAQGVTFAGTPAGSLYGNPIGGGFVIVSDTVITAAAPQGPWGAVTVTVTKASGAQVSATFTYAVKNLQPNPGPGKLPPWLRRLFGG